MRLAWNRLGVACTAIAIALGACSSPDRAKPAAPKVGAPLVAPGLRLPDLATPLAYELRLDIDPDRETFSGEIWIKTRIDKPTDHVWLHVHELELRGARWDGGDLAIDPVKGDQMRAFRFGRVVEPGTVTLAIEFTGAIGTGEEGLFRQNADDKWYAFTQGESVYMRRIAPCFDEPRFKTPWRLTLVVPRGDVALANTPEVESRVIDDRVKEVSFAPTGPMPSYLLAFAVGPFDLVDAGAVGRTKVPVRVAVRAGEGKHVEIVKTKLPAIVDAIEAYVDDALPAKKLDLVAVPHLFGAMENPGLITFDEEMLIGDPKATSFANNFVTVAAHEVAHQWFGNLVTPAWWDDLWLSEGFASWLGDKVAERLGAIDDPPLRDALTRREAIEADDDPSSVPLRRAVATNEAPDDSFDAIAYQKAQEVLSTIEGFVGENVFREQIRAYLAAHRERCAAATDLYAAFPSEIARMLEQYASSPRVPVVDLALRCERGTKPVVIAHARSGTVPVCIRFSAAKANPSETCALVSERTELPVGDSCPVGVFGNARGGYYHVAWAALPPPASLVPGDPRSRIIRGDDAAAALTRGELDAGRALIQLHQMTPVWTECPRCAPSSDPFAGLGAVALAKRIDALVDERDRPRWSERLATRFAPALRRVGREPHAVIELAEALIELIPPDRYPESEIKSAMAALDPMITDATEELPQELVTLAAQSGGDKLYARILERARRLDDHDLQVAWLGSLGRFGSSHIARTIDLLGDASLTTDGTWAAVAAYLARPATRLATWRAVRPRLPKILERMPAAQLPLVIGATAGLCDATSRDDVAAIFDPRAKSIPDGRSLLDAALAAIDRCIAARAKFGDFAKALDATRDL